MAGSCLPPRKRLGRGRTMKPLRPLAAKESGAACAVRGAALGALLPAAAGVPADRIAAEGPTKSIM